MQEVLELLAKGADPNPHTVGKSPLISQSLPNDVAIGLHTTERG